MQPSKFLLQMPAPVEGADDIAIDRFPFIIGRGRDVECSLPWPFISRRHCRFLLRDGQLCVQDLESRNGTYVNGRRAGTLLRVDDGDEVSFGPLSFRVLSVGDRPDTTPALSLDSTNESNSLVTSHDA